MVIALVTGTGAAQGAPAAKHRGEVANDATAYGNCVCSAVQFADLGLANSSYTFPYDGVIAQSGFYVGEEVNPGDWVQMRTFSRSGTNHATVTGDGAQHMLQGLSAKANHTFYERVPVAHFGGLGARYSIGSAFINATPTYFNSTHSVDEVLGTTASLSVGDSFEGTPGTSLRVNVEAVIEPDEDHDDYGDVSQDLCPESPIGGGPCSGALFGSDLRDAHSGGGGAGFEPLLVQKMVDGASTAVPFDGVVVRWRVLSSNNSEYRIRVLSPEAGSTLKVLASSPVESVSVEPSPPIGKLTSFATRLPIPAGSYVGLASPTHSLAPIALNATGASATELHDAPDGTAISGPGTARAWEVAYDADIEPDADHDGYGDITQDSCPEASAIHEGACPPKPPSETDKGSAVPRITSLEVVPKKFRVKAKGYSAKLKLKLSGAAAVAIGIEAKKSCGKRGRTAHCKPRFHTVQTLRKRLSDGPSTVPFSARMGRHGKEVPLPPGRYRVLALPTAAKMTGPGKSETFTILAPRHRGR